MKRFFAVLLALCLLCAAAAVAEESIQLVVDGETFNYTFQSIEIVEGKLAVSFAGDSGLPIRGGQIWIPAWALAENGGTRTESEGVSISSSGDSTIYTFNFGQDTLPDAVYLYGDGAKDDAVLVWQADGSASAEDTAAKAVEIPEGAVFYTAANGTNLILIPSNEEAFWAQDESTDVREISGPSYMPASAGVSNNIASPGEVYPLSVMKQAMNAAMPIIVFSYITTDPENAADAIEELSGKTTLTYGGTDYRVMAGWVTDGYACFFTMCESPREEIPVFTLEDDKLTVTFGE